MASCRRSRFSYVITRRNVKAKYIFLLAFGCVAVIFMLTQVFHPNGLLRYLPKTRRLSKVPSQDTIPFNTEVGDTFSLNIQPQGELVQRRTHTTPALKPREVSKRKPPVNKDIGVKATSKQQKDRTPPEGKSIVRSNHPRAQRANENALDTFQPINTHDAWIYSSFYDPLHDKHFLLQTFGMESINTTKGTIYCHVTERGSVTILTGRRRPLPDPHGRSYIAVSYECTLKATNRPEYVSLTFNVTDEPTNRVPVIYPGQRSRNFTVCYSALFNYKNPTHLITSLAYNQVLGAEHFYVYNHSVSNTTDAVLRHYQRLGLLTVLQWSLPTLGIWYYGQNLAINDCVYRNKFVSQFVVIQDTDELIIPNHHNSWLALIDAAEAEYTETQISANATSIKPLGSYTFESSLHSGTPSPSVWRDIKHNFSISSEMETFLVDHSILPFVHLQRLNSTFKYKVRTKTIVRPERVLFAGIHFTHYHVASATHTVVSNDLAIVHHYSGKRVSEYLDTSSLRFVKRTYDMLRTAFQAFSFL
ncbi:unnamed protein product [Lymnaea stagnalis]|uniref:Glycosyltransferase family 92 protein n=1 Tax=Lymnaea stagnalis TaxID=6523 RepID=A0AAV2IQP0_LYMST